MLDGGRKRRFSAPVFRLFLQTKLDHALHTARLADQVNHAFEGWATADGWEQGLERIFASLEENRTAILNIYRPRFLSVEGAGGWAYSWSTVYSKNGKEVLS